MKRSIKEIAESSKVTLVEFYASWCPHCQKMMPVVDQVKQLLDGRVEVLQFDVDKNAELADEARVETIPAFILYKNGKVYWTHEGEIEAQTLLDTIEQAIDQ